LDASRAKIDQKALANLRLRVVVAIAGIVAILGALQAGRMAFAVVIAAICGLALGEFFGLTRQHHCRPNEVLGVAAGCALPLAAVLYNQAGLIFVLAAATVLTLLWYLAFSGTNLTDMAMTLFGTAYVGLLLSFLVLIDGLGKGTQLVLLVLVGTWINDTVAYLGGVALGKRRLAPDVSPGKTWEGTIIGGASTVGALGAMVFVTYLDTVERMILGGTIAVAAVIGDLAESRIKRELGVKDAGRRIPGHGGFLDRFDSLLFVSPASYYVLTALFKLR